MHSDISDKEHSIVAVVICSIKCLVWRYRLSFMCDFKIFAILTENTSRDTESAFV